MEWLEHALVALSEGFCPNHHTHLRSTGWCATCRIWYHADFPARTVLAEYPIPETRNPEP